MKIQQFKYILGVANNDFNVSKTAELFFTSQPGVSKQIGMLEDELKVKIFERHGRMLTGITPAGKIIIDMAQEVIDKVESIKKVAQEYTDDSIGSLTIATTHCQARYFLPDTIVNFTKKYSSVSFHMQQDTPKQICEAVSKGMVDLAITSEGMSSYDNLIVIPCYSWNRVVIVRPDHPLAASTPLTLQKLAQYPIVTYIKGFTGRIQLDNAFETEGLTPDIVSTASDSDTIKAYVRMKLGVGIIASLAYDINDDSDLVALDASHLFEPTVTKITLKRGITIRNYIYEFIKLFSPHLTDSIINQVVNAKSNAEIDDFFSKVELPHY
jgi:LysR family cys regulon transcriptional activator